MNLERTMNLEDSCAEPQPRLLAAQAAGLVCRANRHTSGLARPTSPGLRFHFSRVLPALRIPEASLPNGSFAWGSVFLHRRSAVEKRCGSCARPAGHCASPAARPNTYLSQSLRSDLTLNAWPSAVPLRHYTLSLRWAEFKKVTVSSNPDVTRSTAADVQVILISEIK